MSGYIGTQPVPQATQTRQTFVATAAQTSFATGGYSVGYLDTFLNGVKLQDGVDYTATNGSDIVLTVGAALDDTLEVVAYTAFEVVNAATAAQGALADTAVQPSDNVSTLTNDAGYTANVGTITGVTAGGGITGGGTSGSVTIDHADTSAQASVNNSGSVYIQDITLDTYGHVTAIASTTVPAPTTAQVGSASAGLAVGSVGSVGFFTCNAGGTVSAGTTVAGSSLTYASVSGGGTLQSGTPAGTWRCMGYRGTSSTVSTTYLRIS